MAAERSQSNASVLIDIFFFRLQPYQTELIVSKSTKCFDEKHFETFANLSRESPKRMKIIFYLLSVTSLGLGQISEILH